MLDLLAALAQLSGENKLDLTRDMESFLSFFIVFIFIGPELIIASLISKRMTGVET